MMISVFLFFPCCGCTEPHCLNSVLYCLGSSTSGRRRQGAHRLRLRNEVCASESFVCSNLLQLHTLPSPSLEQYNGRVEMDSLQRFTSRINQAPIRVQVSSDTRSEHPIKVTCLPQPEHPIKVTCLPYHVIIPWNSEQAWGTRYWERLLIDEHLMEVHTGAVIAVEGFNKLRRQHTAFLEFIIKQETRQTDSTSGPSPLSNVLLFPLQSPRQRFISLVKYNLWLPFSLLLQVLFQAPELPSSFLPSRFLLGVNQCPSTSSHARSSHCANVFVTHLITSFLHQPPNHYCFVSMSFFTKQMNSYWAVSYSSRSPQLLNCAE